MLTSSMVILHIYLAILKWYQVPTPPIVDRLDTYHRFRTLKCTYFTQIYWLFWWFGVTSLLWKREWTAKLWVSTESAKPPMWFGASCEPPPRSRWKPADPMGSSRHHQQEGWPGDPKFLGLYELRNAITSCTNINPHNTKIRSLMYRWMAWDESSELLVDDHPYL